MTDAIITAQQISGCLQQTTLLSLSQTIWQGLTFPEIVQEYPEFTQYLKCLETNLIRISDNNQQRAIALGGLKNPQIQQICEPLFEKNKKVYCAIKIRNQPPQSTQQSTGSIEPTYTKNIELLQKQQEAKAQKLLAEKQTLLLKELNKKINELKSNLIKVSNSKLSSNPQIAKLIQPQIEKIINKIVDESVKLAKDKIKKSRSSITKSKEVFTYPMIPMTPEFTTLSVETPIPDAPTISPLPITPSVSPVPQPPRVEPENI